MNTKRLLILLVTMIVSATSWADIAINETNFPDANFRNFLLQESYGTDKVLTSYEIRNVSTMYVANRNIMSLQGIEYFTELTELMCFGNKLTSLDVSRCTKLQILYCRDNQLTSLNVSGCTSLTNIDCYNNKLTSLDVSNNTKLTSLSCYSNQIKGLAMKKLVESLPTLSSSSRLYIISNENEGNVMTTSEAATATAKGWAPYYTKGELNSYGYPIWLVYAGSEPTKTYDAEVGGIYYNFIKKAKLAKVTSGEYEYTGNIEIPETVTYEGLTYNVTTITGGAFSGCTGLTSVTIPNSVTTIESAAFADCSKLTTVFIGSGVETIGDAFTNCEELTDVYCYATNVPTTNSNAFKDSYVEYATLYIPAASMSAYKAAAPWSGFGTFMDASNLFINEAMFPDEDFRKYLLSQSYGSDGILTAEEIASVTKLYVAYRNIQSLQGIEFFTALTELDCWGNQLTSLNVSKNTALTDLRCYNNQITALDVSKNTALTELNCSHNQISSLDISKNTALTSLQCSGNKLISLDVSRNTALTYLDCSSNQFTTLDVSKNTMLTELICGGNKLTSLDVSRNTALTNLNCFSSQLTSLDISKNTMLTKLDCHYNYQLTSLDVSNNTLLTNLLCYSSKLTSLDVSKNTMLTELQCYSNNITSLDVSKNTALTRLYCNYNQLTSLDVSKNTKLRELQCFANQLSSIYVTGCVTLQYLQCYSNKLTSLNVSGCTALTQLNCYNNQLTSLDASGCTALTNLECYNNKLTSLNISGCTVLRWLNCYQNQIKGAAMDALVASLPTVSYGTMQVIYNVNELNAMTTIQVAAAKAKGWKPCYYESYRWEEYAGSEPGLENIEINETNFPDEVFRYWLLGQTYGSDGILTPIEIASVDYINVSSRNIKSLQGIGFFTALTRLYCDYNQLTSLDLSGCTMLTELQCYRNQIKGAGMDALVANLPTVSNGTMKVINHNDVQNVMTTTQVAAAKAKGWTPCYEYSIWGRSEWREYAGSIAIDKVNFPDENFRKYLLSQSYGNDSILTETEIANISEINVHGKDIKSLKGIEFLTNLNYLYCFSNQLTSLDVSKNTRLTKLNCYGNQLTSLNVSGCTNMINLYCNNNKLTSLDVSECTALTTLECYENRLTSLDMSGCTALKTLDCHKNQFTSLNVSNNIYMTELRCYDNKLTSLDVSKNTELTMLQCTNNQIKGAAMDMIVNSLPTHSGYIYVISNVNEGNVMTTLQVAAVKAKGWIPWCYNGSKWIGYLGSEPTVLRGDANGDGEIGMPDVMFIVNYILGTPDASFDAEAADANLDGEVGMPDVMFIVNYILNGEFPKE